VELDNEERLIMMYDYKSMKAFYKKWFEDYQADVKEFWKDYTKNIEDFFKK